MMLPRGWNATNEKNPFFQPVLPPPRRTFLIWSISPLVGGLILSTVLTYCQRSFSWTTLELEMLVATGACAEAQSILFGSLVPFFQLTASQVNCGCRILGALGSGLAFDFSSFVLSRGFSGVGNGLSISILPTCKRRRSSSGVVPHDGLLSMRHFSRIRRSIRLYLLESFLAPHVCRGLSYRLHMAQCRILLPRAGFEGCPDDSPSSIHTR